MRRYFIGGALVLVTALGTFFAIGGGPGTGPATGRVQRPARYGGRVWPTAQQSQCFEYPASTNYALSSQDLATGWSAANTGSTNPTPSADTSIAPTCAAAKNIPGCGLVTADRIQVPAVGAAENSFIYQAGCPNQIHSTGWWVCGTAGGVSETGTADIYTGGGTINGSFRCPFTVCPNWTRCTRDNSDPGTTLGIGNFGNLPPVGARAALDIQVWQADCQDSDTITPSIPTAGASVARDAGCVSGATKVLAGMGDSITLASGTGLYPLPVRVAYALDPVDFSYGWIQGGVAGETCADILARWPSVKAQGVTHLFLHCGVNDARTGRTAAAAWADQLALLTDALASGVKPRLVKTLNFEGAVDADPAKVTMINDLKVLQQAWCDSHGLACADPAATMQTGNALINHQGDFLHPNGTGSEQLKTAIYVWAERAAEGWP